MLAVEHIKDKPISCPSAEPTMEEAQILGVVLGTPTEPRVAYLEESVAATADVVSQAGQANPLEICRFSAACQERRCVHFDGADCQLGSLPFGSGGCWSGCWLRDDRNDDPLRFLAV